MSEYKIMYYRLFCQVQDAIELLQKAQRECETIMAGSDDNDEDEGEG